MTSQRLLRVALIAAIASLFVMPGASALVPAVEVETPEIAFETPSGIYLIRPDGSGLTRLPGTRPGDLNPNWSPDGRRLVFWRGTGWHGRLHVTNLTGSQRRLLTRDPSGYGASDQWPTWSPDGRLIAFDSFRSGAWHIWVMRPDGTEARQVTPQGYGGRGPRWAPDSKRIVYGAAWAATGLAITTLAGHVRALKTGATRDWAPAWSPDGRRIAFMRTIGGTYRNATIEIYTVAARGGKPTALTRNHVGDFDPHWSPDSKRIVFTSRRNGLDEVYVMQADGSEQTRITRLPTQYACCATWRGAP